MCYVVNFIFIFRGGVVPGLVRGGIFLVGRFCV